MLPTSPVLPTSSEMSFTDSTEQALALVGLSELIKRSRGRPEIRIGLIDGPVTIDHPGLATQRLECVATASPAQCYQSEGYGPAHGTFVAGILCASRNSSAPGICSDCTLLIHPVFAERAIPGPQSQPPSAPPSVIVTAIIDCVEAGASVINLSLAETHPPFGEDRELSDALDLAARRGVFVVAAAGNQASLAGSPIARHPWVIPVVPCNLDGLALKESNLSSSIAKRGLSAPGTGITSLTVGAEPAQLIGSSIAAPLVTGAIGLLLSEFPDIPAAAIRFALTGNRHTQRRGLVPPLLDAWTAFQHLAQR
jgi:subtilisin family serine protease